MRKLVHYILNTITNGNNFEQKANTEYPFKKPVNDCHVYCFPRLKLDIILGVKK